MNIGGYTKTVKLNITDSAESIKFTSSQGSVAIPLDEKSVTTAKYSAAVINGEGADLGRNVTLEIYDRNNVNKYTLPEGISFDASKGIVSVTSAAVPAYLLSELQVKAVTEKHCQEALRLLFTVCPLTLEAVRTKVLQRVIQTLIRQSLIPSREATELRAV